MKLDEKNTEVAQEICRRAFGNDFLGELERANHLVAVNPEKLKERLGEMCDRIPCSLCRARSQDMV